MKQKLLLLMLLIQLPIWLVAQVGTIFSAKCSNGHVLKYKIISSNSVEVTNKVGCTGFPDTKIDANGESVEIVEKANYNYVNVVIPKTVLFQGKSYSVTSIGFEAFYGCSRLKTIEIPSTVTKIGYWAFRECSSLQRVTIPNSVVEIEMNAFGFCKSLSRIQLSSILEKLGNYCFVGCSLLKEIELPTTLTYVPPSCFYECTSLKEVKLSPSTEWIGQTAFVYCSFDSIDIPKSVKEIYSQAFGACSNLKKVKGLHENMDIKYDAFDACPFTLQKYLFDNIVYEYVVGGLKKWQEKREFETSVEYKRRVTVENQKKKVNELMGEIIKKYTQKNKIVTSLEKYDADNQLFLVNSNYGSAHIKVPRAEAPSFKSQFNKAGVKATYIATGEGLKVDDLTIELDGKTYYSVKGAVNSNPIIIDLPYIGFANMSGEKTSSDIVPKDLSIDQNIPANATNNMNTFAVIIGNEKYGKVAQVPYANNDAKIFAEYCKKTLGLPAQNVKVYENASYGTMIGAVSNIQKIAKAYKGDINVIFYYAGHGIPDEATGDGYLLPVDADGLNMRVCYPLSQLYKELGDMQVKSVTCFMDACFSGAQRGNGMIVAARGVAIKAKADAPQGNTVVFTAATDKQTAYPYKEKGHGMFTYYLLKKLRETKGDCTLGELGAYISDQVAKQAVVTNGKEQTPVVLTSQGIANDWKNLKLK